jgi:type IV pilus assembly protein PilB
MRPVLLHAWWTWEYPAIWWPAAWSRCLGQRLVRTICKRCKTQFKLSERSRRRRASPEVAERATFAKGKGCGYCQKSGYRGRMGIYELMVVSSKIREMMFKESRPFNLPKQAIKEG